MKFNIEVDVADIIESAGKTRNFDYEVFKELVIKAVKENIIETVNNMILSEIKDQVVNDIRCEITSRLDTVADSLQSDIVNDIINGQKITLGSGCTRKTIIAKDYIYEKVISEVGKCINQVINEVSGKACKQLKDRYDLAFAAAIIDKLRKQKLLNDDVAKLITTDNTLEDVKE